MATTADNVEMQGIEFQIINDSDEATNSIERLGQALSALKINVKGGISAVSRAGSAISKLRTALDGIDTSGIANKLKGVSDAVNNLKIDPSVKVPASLSKNLAALNAAVARSDTGKIIGLRNALKSMDDVSKINISSALPKNITALNAALSVLDISKASKLTTLAQALKPFGEIEKAQLSATFIKNLKAVPEVVKEFESLDMEKFAQQMKSLADALRPFADEMNKVSSGFSAFPSRIQRLITSTEQYNGTVRRATSNTNAFGKALKGLSILAIAKSLSKFFSSAIVRASDYQETLAMFQASMGEYAEEAYNYAQKVNEVMGINPAEWMKNQGVFQSIITGFGVAGDKAAIMSKNLTQLGYDLSAFYNLSFEETMQKVRSGISGELEPLRNLGYDLSVARLQQEVDSLGSAAKNLSVDLSDSYLEQERLNLGIQKSVSNMNQAEKAQLRYHAMMTQLTVVQGAMARELDSPINQLRILRSQLEQASQAFGNLFIPILNKVLPPLIAVASALRQVIAAIAKLFNIKMADSVDWGKSFGSAATGSGAVADNMDSAAGSAKELKRYLAGFDELNVLPDQSKSGGGGGAGGGGGGMLDLNPEDYDFLGKAVTEKVDEWKAKIQPVVDWITEHLQDIFDWTVAIGAEFASWKIAQNISDFLDKIKGQKGANLLYQIGFKIVGLGLFLDSWRTMKEAIDSIVKYGPTFSNVTQLLSGFSEGVGTALLMLGNIKAGGVMLIISGITGVASAISDMAKEGINFNNLTNFTEKFGIFLAGISLSLGNIKVASIELSLSGVVLIIRNLKDVVEAIKTGNWENVNKIEVVSGVALAVGGLFTVLSGVKEKLGGASAAKSVIDTVTQSTEALSTRTATMSTKMLSLVKNVGLGVTVLAEVAAGMIIFAGAIAVVGVELDKAAQAWQPVIDNAGTVAIAVAVGTGLMATIGAACYGLGMAGKSAALNIGIGTAILLELGVATGLFIVEIWAIGKGLDEIGKAWEPVLNNGENIATAIGIGTGLLVGVGVVTAALGVATVGTSGLLPLAIAAGTALLVELSIAFVEFSDSLVDVANELNNNLAPALHDLNGTLPGLKSDMHDFTVFMTGFATEISDYTKSMGKITWSTLIGKFQKLFSGNPMQGLATDVGTIATDTANLNGKLQTANSELQTAIALLTDYISFMDTMKTLTASEGTVELSTGLYTNLKDAGSKLVTGFSDGMMAEAPLLDSAFNRILSSQNAFSTRFLSTWNSLWSGVSVSFVGYWNSIIGNMSVGMNSIIYATNNIISAMNAIMHTLGYTGGLTKIPSVSIPRYANGGYVDQGQLFIAREAGAEMVGSIGRRTAVANNDQIVESITYGVREANDDVVTAIYAVAQQVISEMRNQGSGNGSGGGYDFDRAVYEANRRNARVYG